MNHEKMCTKIWSAFIVIMFITISGITISNVSVTIIIIQVLELHCIVRNVVQNAYIVYVIT
jgi:cytochrome b subunit of formate dehydrogenase